MWFAYEFFVIQGLRVLLGSERYEVKIQLKATHVVFNCLSQINIELNISVEINLITTVITLETALLALHKYRLVYNLITFTFAKQIQRLLCFDFYIRCTTQHFGSFRQSPDE
jgi:hypothetical protein